MMTTETHQLVFQKGLNQLISSEMLHIFQTFPKFCLSRITLFCGNFWKIQILFAEGFKLSACLNDRSMIGGQ